MANYLPEMPVVKWRNAIRASVSKMGIPAAGTIEVRTKYFDYGHQIGMAVAMNLLTQNIDRYRWPANWKEAVKERFCPKVLLKRWPVKYRTVDVLAIYPKAKLPDPVFKAKEIFNEENDA